MTEMVQGLTSAQPVLCFTGNSNLKSRSSYFASVVDHISASLPTETRLVLCGRSMGSRAAVLAYTELRSSDHAHQLSDCLLLYSYPLTSGGKRDHERTQILLDLPADSSVLFLSGSKDSMCDLDNLNAVRAQMRARSFLVVLRDADHGLEVSARRGKKKEATTACGVRLGELAAEWLREDVGVATESEVVFDGEEPIWSGWLASAGLQGWRDQRALVETGAKGHGKRLRDEAPLVDSGDADVTTEEPSAPQRRSKRARR